MKLFSNAAVFVIMYVLFMLPTYVLPYFGSNSSVLNTIVLASDDGFNPLFFLHLGLFIVLIVIAWFRGVLIDKKWLIIFPIMSAVFDLTPFLNHIPLIPTIMHLLVIILGVVVVKSSVPVGQQSA
jgi:hypothetical protein